MMRNAKKWSGALTAVCLASLVADAGATAIRVDLTTRYAQPKTVLLNQDGEPLAMDSVAMLFWSATQDFDGFNSFDPTAPLGGDILLATFPTTGGGVPLAGHITNLAYANTEFRSADYGVSLPSGYVYLAVFNYAYSDFIERGFPAYGAYHQRIPVMPFNVGNKPDPTFMPDDIGLAITNEGPFTTEMISLDHGLEGFEGWLHERGLHGDLNELFVADFGNGIPSGMVFAFGVKLIDPYDLIRIRVVDGEVVVEVLEQDEESMGFVDVIVEGTDDLTSGAWTLQVEPVAPKPDTPADRKAYGVNGDAPSVGVFRVRVVLR